MSTETLAVANRRNPWSAPYWEGVARGELRYQHCLHCERNVFPARRFCPRCASSELEWHSSAGEGTLYSFSVLERGAIAAFEDAVPYAILVVDLAEGFRMTTGLAGSDFAVLRCGLRVRVTFDDTRGGIPMFVPAELAD